MNLNKGFTLIELLVVVAIIGILASVVLASLNTARAKGADAAIKANLANIRAQSELIYDTQGCYGDGAGSCASSAFAAGACATTADTIFAEPTVAGMIASADSAGGFTACSSTANQALWAVVVQLKSSTAAGWCVDSTGKSKQVTIASAFGQTEVTAEVASGACVE